ncbi:MAG: PD-(D/E)XK nuclease family protein [Deltaproteobacteria bacterium]|nr:PD-(D/E)XK nuclease family protein [Deltaproteobacteria bacterium]
MADLEKYDTLLKSYTQLHQKLTIRRKVSFARLLEDYFELQKALYCRNREKASNFNPFNLLGLTTDELAHSTVLADLFDPYGTHNQGDLFFRHFINHFGFNIDYDPWEYRVRKEYVGIESRIDILVYGKKFIFYIENKTLSSEGLGQTEREYGDLLRFSKILNISRDNIFPIFLNPKGELPKDEHWTRVSYSLLAQSLDGALCEVKSDYVRFFVQSWLSILKMIGGME